MILGDVIVFSCGYSDCETEVVLSDYLIYAVSEVYADWCLSLCLVIGLVIVELVISCALDWCS